MKDSLNTKINTALIVSVTPYFLEKGNVWFEENWKRLLEVRNTQAFFKDSTVCIEKDQEYNLSEFLRKLDELGYEKVLEVDNIGEFSQRGGTVDVFPINMNTAIRFDFVGNKIESIEQLATTIEDEEKSKELLKRKLKSQKLFSDLKGLQEGDYIVHLDHGVSTYTGIEDVSIGKTQQKYYVLEYAAKDRLYVPIGLERKLSRYIGFVEPRISRLGSSLWQRTKRRIKDEIEKLAKELLELYAKREIATRPPYTPEDEIEKKLQATFPYEETPDQIQTLEDIHRDLEKVEPMDRIVCGDVGFGKTEIALRTMARAVKNGYQTALLAPTTILAYQHFQNFRDRLKDLPIQVVMLSRLQSKKEQKEILKDLKSGKVDIIIGTHRLLSKDVQFAPPPGGLGLLVIDDEQRFGVKQKERFKEFRASLDVLALSATPIPRTLYMALSSLKSISIIQTPPAGRLSVKVTVTQRKDSVIKEAIETELKRRGQVYYLHNRIGTIEQVKKYLEKLVPRVKIGIAHGRLTESRLISIMDEFRNEKFDVLLATTIIENGLDFPNVNTLIAEDATKLGLAQAYQIRGRVGRSHIQSYAYFLYEGRLSDKAKMRLKALREAEELGSGYRIAMKDLEIRGAGNILGKEQSGSVNAVGLNLYCQMLSETIENMRQ